MKRLVGVWIGRSEKRVPPVLPSNCNQDPFETRVANQSGEGCQVRYADPKGVNLDGVILSLLYKLDEFGWRPQQNCGVSILLDFFF